MRYAVTGGAGFVGSHLVDRLVAEGHAVLVVDSLVTGRLDNLAEVRRRYPRRMTFHQIDIRDHNLAGVFRDFRPDAIAHLAAQASVVVSVRDPMLDAGVNVVGTLNVLEAAVAGGAGRVVLTASGGAMYGERKTLPIPETVPRNPESPYGISKAIGEMYARFYERHHSLTVPSLALANVYGPRQDPFGEGGVVAIFAGRMLAGEAPTIFGDGTDTRDYVFVEDVVDAFCRALERGKGVVNVGTGVETSTNEVHRAIAAACGYRAAPVHGPSRPGDLHRSAVDIRRAAKEIGWEPFTDFPEGARITVDWFRERAAKPARGKR